MLIGHVFPRIRIVHPLAVGDEFVLVASGPQNKGRPPAPAFLPLHRCGLWFPIVEVAANRDLPGLWGIQNKRCVDRL